MEQAENSESTSFFWRVALVMAAVVFVGVIILSVRSAVGSKRVRQQSDVRTETAQLARPVCPAAEPPREAARFARHDAGRLGEPYGDYEFRRTLEEHKYKQIRDLREEARADSGAPGEKRSLSLTEDRIKKLEESGNLIF